LARSRYILPQQVLHKTANGCQTAIAGHCGVPTARFYLIQKPEHSFGLDIFESQVGHGLALLIGEGQKEELQRVTVGSHRMRARSSCVPQIAVEEALDQAEE
jgi:hypothetical protein